MTDLEKARQRINEADEKMAEWFQVRMSAAETVAKYKKEHGLPVEDPAREAQVIACNAERVPDDYRAYYISFLKHNMELSKKLQHRLLDGMRVAFSGVSGAFAEISARRIFPDAKTVPYPDFKGAYRAVEQGKCDCVLLPVENSFNGDVGQVMDLAFFGSLYINGVYEAEIVQNLLAIPGTDLSQVRSVISHPQALGQCAPYIEAHGWAPVEAVNTAVAAQQVAESGRHDLAAIASEEAAEQFGLIKLEGHINQSSTNTTRFAVFSPVRKEPSPADERFILLFTVKNAAGSLGKAISVIGEHGFNLRALKSRPTKELIWDYYFYAEGEGCIESDSGKAMLTELKKHCNDLRVIGSFEKEIRI